MFRLSQKSDYGLILLSNLTLAQTHLRGGVKSESGLHLGGVATNRYVSVSDIARKNQISPKFLSQIASELKRAGILVSREGASGGYTLAKSANQIKLLDVLKVLDGELVKGECFEEGHECSCGAGEMWADMKMQMEETIGKKTVADLVVTK